MLDFISVGGVIDVLTNILPCGRSVQSFTGFSLIINYPKTTWEHILEETLFPRCPICTTWLDAGCFTIFFKISLFWLQLNAQTCIQHSSNTPRNSANSCWPLLLCFCHATQHLFVFFCFALKTNRWGQQACVFSGHARHDENRHHGLFQGKQSETNTCKKTRSTLKTDLLHAIQQPCQCCLWQQ